jgi:ABC-type branched-subunit amino acid transport system substrate-binding protein
VTEVAAAMRCPTCSEPVGERDEFCEACGRRIRSAPPAVVTADGAACTNCGAAATEREQSFTQAGGTVVKRTGLPADTMDFRGALTEARSLGADAVFFGGVASDGSGLVSAQMKEIGL